MDIKRRLSPEKKQLGQKRPKIEASNIKVCVRLRPFTSSELKRGVKNVISMVGNQVNIEAIDDKSFRKYTQGKSFEYDETFWSFDKREHQYVDQKATFEKLGKQYLNHTFEGYNACIFAYGQTGSGKSYTMMGDNSHPGLVPRVCKDIFNRCEVLLTDKRVAVTVKISYFEIYNEDVYDLLAENRRTNLTRLRVRESPETGPYVENLSEFVVKSYEDVWKYFNMGTVNRKTASTKLNVSSSRSHAIFTISIKQIQYSDAKAEKVVNVKKSSLRLVDLAGSERANSTKAMGERLKEGSNINKSLTCLGRVINTLALNTITQEKPVIPFRDSVLTWILKESLGGNSKTAMVACISPGDYEETLSTLRYASNAKKIKTEARINKNDAQRSENAVKFLAMELKLKHLEEVLAKKAPVDEKEIIQQTHQKLSNNYKKYLEFYDEKLVEEQDRNQILVNEINRLTQENKQLSANLNSIVGPVVRDIEVNKPLKSEISLAGITSLKSPSKRQIYEDKENAFPVKFNSQLEKVTEEFHELQNQYEASQKKFAQDFTSFRKITE